MTNYSYIGKQMLFLFMAFFDDLGGLGHFLWRDRAWFMFVGGVQRYGLSLADNYLIVSHKTMFSP